MTKSTIIAFAVVLSALLCAPQGASAIDVGSAACKRELKAAQQLMLESAAVVDSGMKASGAERCKALSRQIDLAERIRESFARCEEPKERTSSVRDADEVIEASQQAFNKWCPSRPGMVRVRMTMVEHVTRDKLPKPLAAVHRCAGDEAAMFSTNQRFDLGRLVVLGCPGNPNPSPEQMKARNASADMLRKEQAYVYLTRDRDGDDPQRLIFPILDADGQEFDDRYAGYRAHLHRRQARSDLDVLGPGQSRPVPRARHLARRRRQGRVGVLGRGGGLFEQQARVQDGARPAVTAPLAAQ